MRVIFFVIFLLAICQSLHAEQYWRTKNTITYQAALKVATRALEKCQELGFRSTVTVVDEQGKIKVQLHNDGAFPHSIQTSYRKALTAASRRKTTSKIEQENQHEPTLGNVFNEIGLITLSGGIPIKFKQSVIGGIGVAGAPGENANGEDFDEICAIAGLSLIYK